mmetsp:Transcript_20012/g.46802  ORF Transcript_20012/g.46802 Transcript_20012/m.46802 type:complete len:107 (+) Transcript_20012:128-448(+)
MKATTEGQVRDSEQANKQTNERTNKLRNAIGNRETIAFTGTPGHKTKTNRKGATRSNASPSHPKNQPTKAKHHHTKERKEGRNEQNFTHLYIHISTYRIRTSCYYT